MSEPIKDCPQPDPPELVMRADGYHYQEDEMSYRELTDKQVMAAAMDCQEANMSCYRAVIAADRALNAPVDRDVMPEAPVTVLPDGSAFFTGSFPLPKDHWLYAPRCSEWDSVRDTTADTPHPILTHEARTSVVAAVRYAVRGATMCGAEKDFDPDAIVQNAVYALCGPDGDSTAALNAPPADRDVMRQVPEGWKLVPIEPTLDQYNSACRAYSDWQVQCQEEAREHEDERNPSWGYSQPHFTHSDVYRAMLAAVPTPPAEQQEWVDLIRAQGYAPPQQVQYYIEGRKVTSEEYIVWLGEELTRVKNANIPPMKFYGSSAEEGDQHEIKSAYVEGWNDCREAMTKIGGKV